MHEEDACYSTIFSKGQNNPTPEIQSILELGMLRKRAFPLVSVQPGGGIYVITSKEKLLTCITWKCWLQAHLVWLSLLEHHPIHKEVTSLIPGQNTCRVEDLIVSGVHAGGSL